MNRALFLLISLIIVSCAKPIARFDLETDRVEAPSTIKFNNLSENADSYMWDFGDGNSSNEAAPSHTYYLSGNYEVKLTAIKSGKKKVFKQKVSVNAPKDCLVAMQTNMGDMVFKLSDETPGHRDNFLKLSNESYYEGLLFHRVIQNFMIQGGDPNSKGSKKGAPLGNGGPGYQIDAEFNPKMVHVKGALAAARQGDRSNPQRKSSGSQFYIVHGKSVGEKELEKIEISRGFEYEEESKLQYAKLGGTPFLDLNYTVFGQLVDGWEVLDEIAQRSTDARDRPEEDIVILKMITIK